MRTSQQSPERLLLLTHHTRQTVDVLLSSSKISRHESKFDMIMRSFSR